MGHDKIEVQKERLKKVLKDLLELNIDLMSLHLTLTNDKKSLATLKKSIKNAKKALDILPHIKHIEILQSLYDTIILGKEHYFVLLASLILKGKIDYWDNSEKGFAEFMELEMNARTKSKEEREEAIKIREQIAKAKAEGKNVELMYKDGKIIPVIVNEKSN